MGGEADFFLIVFFFFFFFFFLRKKNEPESKVPYPLHTLTARFFLFILFFLVIKIGRYMIKSEII